MDDGREVCIIDPALQGTQSEIKGSIKDILHGLLNNISLEKPVRMRQRHTGEDVKHARGNQLEGADDHVKILFIGELTIGNGEQGESTSQVCLFVPLIK